VYEVFDEIAHHYQDYIFEPQPIEIIDYHQKCPL